MSLFFVCCCVLYCAFDVCAFDQCDTVVQDRSVSRPSDEVIRSSSHGSCSTIPGNSVDGVEGCCQYVVVKDENGNGAQFEIDRQFYEECINVEFKLPE